MAFGSSATLNIEIGGTTQGTGYDHLNVTGDLALDGALEVSLINGFNPIAGQSFNILDWLGTRTGTFSSLVLPTLAGLAWNTSQLYTTGVLSVAAAGLPGDFNNNGTVDAADYVVWRKTDGTPADYNTWRTNFGQTVGSVQLPAALGKIATQQLGAGTDDLLAGAFERAVFGAARRPVPHCCARCRPTWSKREKTNRYCFLRFESMKGLRHENANASRCVFIE